MEAVPVAAGAGDNAAGAIGVGVIQPGQAFLSLGTSGVIFVAGERFAPAPDKGAHAFCHALPDRWHQMSVMLSAASCLDWVARLTGFADVAAAMTAAQQRPPFAGPETFLPYLAGERTPHNDPGARGAFVHLGFDSDPAALVRAVLEGVAFGLAEGLDVLVASDVGGHRELIRHGETGWLFKAGSAASLAQSVGDLLSQPERWPELRAAGRRFVETSRNWGVSVANYPAVYERLAAARIAA